MGELWLFLGGLFVALILEELLVFDGGEVHVIAAVDALLLLLGTESLWLGVDSVLADPVLVDNHN